MYKEDPFDYTCLLLIILVYPLVYILCFMLYVYCTYFGASGPATFLCRIVKVVEMVKENMENLADPMFTMFTMFTSSKAMMLHTINMLYRYCKYLGSCGSATSSFRIVSGNGDFSRSNVYWCKGHEIMNLGYLCWRAKMSLTCWLVVLHKF